MDRYDTGDDFMEGPPRRGRGRSSSQGRRGEAQPRRRSRSNTRDSKKASSRGRSREGGRGRSPRRSRSRGTQSGNSSSSVDGASRASTPTALQMQSLSRTRSHSPSRSKRNKSQRRSRSATPSRRRSRSASNRRNRDGRESSSRGRSNAGKKGYDLKEDSRSTPRQSGDHQRRLQEYDEESNTLENTHAAAQSKFTNVTIESFLPNNLHGVSGLKLGQCLFTELRNAKTWSVGFVLRQLLGGLAVMCAQFPECLSYAYIAGIDPFHALQATWIANALTPIVGGRPGLMCGSSGLGAVAIRYLVTYYGQEYIYYAIILSGFCQVLFGALRIGKYLRLLPPGITIGMVNALCVMLVLLQLRYFKEFPSTTGVEDSDTAVTAVVAALKETAHTSSTINEPTRYLESVSSTKSEDSLNQPWAYFYGLDLPWTDSTSQIVMVSLQAFAALAICFLLPRVINIFPSSLVAIIVLSLVNFGIRKGTDWVAPTVGDYCTSELPSSRSWQGIFHPSYSLPSLAEWRTLKAVVPSGLSLACVNLLETMVTINVADNYTDTDSEQDRVFYGQGVANLASGLMAGTSSAGSPHASLHGLRMRGVTSAGVFFAGMCMLMVMTFAYPAVAGISLGSTMGVTLYLILSMMQWTPIVSFVLKFVPTYFKQQWQGLGRFRLATPDLFSAFVTSAIALCGSTYAIAGYLTGVLCYACDPIGHAIILNEDGDGYNFARLELSKAPTKKWRRRREKSSLTTRTRDESTNDFSGYDSDEESVMDQICEAICGDECGDAAVEVQHRQF